MATGLRSIGGRFADPVVLAAAASTPSALRGLFDDAESVVLEDVDAEFALTVYTADGTPLAWAGRPSELPTDRLQGTESWFFVQGALGQRLVYVVPVLAVDGRRVGIVAVERAIEQAGGLDADGAGAFAYPTRFSRVAIELSFENPRTRPDPMSFDVQTPNGDLLLTASVSPETLARARTRWRRASASLATVAGAVVVLLLCGPLLDWRNRSIRWHSYVPATASIGVAVVLGRLILRAASPADWSNADVVSAAIYASPLLPPFLTSPFDYLATALAGSALVALALFAVEGWRIACRGHRITLGTAVAKGAYVAAHLAAGALVAVILNAQFGFIRDTIANATVDLLHFSLHPWNSSRIALQAGLILFHASAVALSVLLLRLADIPWRVRRHDLGVRVGTALLWATPAVAWLLSSFGVDRSPLWIAVTAVVALSALAPRIRARYRHGSQAFRLLMLTLGLVVPALAFYPSVFQLARASKVEMVESRYAPQALNQRQTTQRLLQESLDEIDAFPGLSDLISVAVGPADVEALTDRAFQVWRVTGLAAYPVTSSVELYGDEGQLVSRFAFNLPEDLSVVPRLEERSCSWEVFEEVSAFFAEERRVLHAGRAVCVTDGSGRTEIAGSIVVHAMLDYANLPFTTSQSPYLELLRPVGRLRDENLSGGDVDYAVYGWSRMPIYSSGTTTWEIDDATFDRVSASRAPRWARLQRSGDTFDVYLTNDRFGMYALGFPVVAVLGHLVNLAELIVLGAGACLVLLLLHAVFGWVSRRTTSARALLREVRASFYRKLFIAFVAASVVPVVALAILTRNYVAAAMNDAVEQEAVRTAAAARRVVEDLVAPRALELGAGVDDNLMVWVSRLIDQDVNIFRGTRLQATSERNLFASGLLPTRTPAPVYRGLELRNETATVNRERVGDLEYLVAGTPVKGRQLDAILTIPLTARQQEIEAQIDQLNRQVLLGALVFILAGAGIGYKLAERIGDPVSRLTRATRRIARGEFDVRVVATSSDELRRLVDDFNQMARELERQRAELERTHRLEAWAEMSRQVAHDIKNPLTPIQLNAEHLRRVHADRGEPLSPILEECVGNILTQVSLLRQIASEFSSFASSPIVKRAPVDVRELLLEIVAPYREALRGRIEIQADLPALPRVLVDRALVSRALTNLFENALHAMPAGGTVTLAARVDDRVRIRISDTGRGMDEEARQRAFEPYFSTKATGTGLGLPIAKRNIELNDGTIAIETGPGGTTLEVALPLG